MYKKISILSCIILVSALLYGCTSKAADTESNQHLWLVTAKDNEKDTGKSTSDKNNNSEIKKENSTTGNTKASLKEMVVELLSDSSGKLHQMLWENQRKSAISELNQQILEKKNLVTYYISSSEGSDNNSGLTPNRPKKTIDKYSGVSNINILLKSGDVFPMQNTFSLGNNVIMASYGEGAQPVLDFYQDLELKWYKVSNYKNVWKADLSNISKLNNGLENQSNYNIGQLLIDGECNWKRSYNANWEGNQYSEYLQKSADGSFAVDWKNAAIYLYDKKDPNLKEISYALPGHGLFLSNTHDTYLMGLEIKGAAFHGVCMSGATNIKVKNLYIHHIGGGFLKGTSTRYGNAIEVWDNATNIEISYNIAEWIFDTCFTNQGNGKNIVQKNVVFRRNIGRFSFWGLESWGDASSEAGFENIRYEENILMYACDVTAPKVQIFSDTQAKNLTASGTLYESGIPYATYRSGEYPFHQMSLISAASGGNKNSLVFQNNVLWGTNRYLTILNQQNRGLGYPEFYNNLFYSEVPNETVGNFRYSVLNGSKQFYFELPMKNNQSVIIIKGQENKNAKLKAEEFLTSVLKKIMIGEK